MSASSPRGSPLVRKSPDSEQPILVPLDLSYIPPPPHSGPEILPPSFPPTSTRPAPQYTPKASSTSTTVVTHTTQPPLSERSDLSRALSRTTVTCSGITTRTGACSSGSVQCCATFGPRTLPEPPFLSLLESLLSKRGPQPFQYDGQPRHRVRRSFDFHLSISDV